MLSCGAKNAQQGNENPKKNKKTYMGQMRVCIEGFHKKPMLKNFDSGKAKGRDFPF